MIKTTFTNGKLKIVCEAQVREVDGKWFADAYLYKGKYSATFFTALNTGELELGEVQLSKAECNWLLHIEDQVCETIDAMDMKDNGIVSRDQFFNEN